MATDTTSDASAAAAPSGGADSATAPSSNGSELPVKQSPNNANKHDSPGRVEAKKEAKAKTEATEPAGSDDEMTVEKKAKKPKASPSPKSRRPAAAAPPTPSREGMRRDRKKVERLSEVIDKQYQEHVDNRVVLPQGRGTKLRDCPRVLYFMYQSKPDDLKLLHSLIFNRAGVANEVRKNLLEFNGFEFGKDSKEFERLVDRAATRKVKELKKSLFALDLERSQSGGTRDMAQRLCEFLAKPFDNGKKPPKKLSFQLMQEGRSGAKKKSKSKSSSSGSKASGKKRAAKKPAAADSSDDDEEKEKVAMETDEDERMSSSSESEPDSDDSDAKKKKKQKKKPAKKASPAKKQKKKASPAAKPSSRKRKASVSSSDSDKKGGADSSDEDDVPLKKLKAGSPTKQPPTDDEIKKAVADVVAKADLDNLLVSAAIKQVYDKFQPLDISDRKAFIKTAIKDLVN